MLTQGACLLRWGFPAWLPLNPMILLLAFVGCSPWLKSPSETPLLPPAITSPESVALEIAFVNVAADERSLEQQLWRQFDEQLFPVEFRRQLNANGLRAGMIGTQLPEELRKLVERTADESQAAPSSETMRGEDSPSMSQRRLQMNTGKRAKVVVSPTFPVLSVLSIDDSRRVVGQQFQQAQCLFSLKAFPEGDGGTRVELTPEIEHGEVKNRWVPVDGALVQQIGKDRHVYERLRLDFHLSPGQTLVLGPTLEPCGVGQPYFSQEQPTQRRVLLLIRLVQSQLDDLFAPRPKKLEVSSTMD